MDWHLRRLLTFALILAAGLGLAAQAHAQKAPTPTRPLTVKRTVADELVVWTFYAIDQAKKTGNVSVLRGLGTPGFRKRTSRAKLAKMVRALKAGSFVFLMTEYRQPKPRIAYSDNTPGIDRASRLILNGCYCPEGYHLYFRFRYRKAGRNWRIDAMKVWDVVD